MIYNKKSRRKVLLLLWTLLTKKTLHYNLIYKEITLLKKLDKSKNCKEVNLIIQIN